MIEKFPSMSLIAPFPEPITITFAPSTISLDLELIIFPEIEAV
jgi:hypothetical protein